MARFEPKGAELARRTRAFVLRLVARNRFGGRWLWRAGSSWSLALIYRRRARALTQPQLQAQVSTRHVMQLMFAPRFEARHRHLHASSSTHITRPAAMQWKETRTLAQSSTHFAARTTLRTRDRHTSLRSVLRTREMASFELAVRAARSWQQPPPAPRGVEATRPPFALPSAGRVIVRAAPLAATPQTLRRSRGRRADSIATDPSLPRREMEDRQEASHQQPTFMAATPLQVEQLAEQVMRHIDRKVIATRERLGRL